MKYYVIPFLVLFTASANAQEAPVKRNEYKTIGITYSSYVKPRASNLYQTDLLQNPNTFDDVRRNIGVTFSYTQMNFLKNFGIEFGIGLELMMTDNSFRFSLPPLLDPTEMKLNDSRSKAGFVYIPLHYVHRIELKNRFTLFPKIGVDAKVLITNPQHGTGIYTDSLNNLSYSLGYETTQLYSNGPFQNVFLNGMIGANLNWSTKKGATFGLQLAFSVQIIRNTLLTRIRDIEYKKDGEVVFDSNTYDGDYYYYDQNGQLVYQPPTKTSDYLAGNRMTNFSIGVSYVFGK